MDQEIVGALALLNVGKYVLKRIWYDTPHFCKTPIAKL
jgi:hypothetical protein